MRLTSPRLSASWRHTAPSGAAPGRFCRSWSALQPDTAPTPLAESALSDQFYACGFKSGDQLRERIDIAAYDAAACLHTLNCWHGQPCKLGQLPLVNPEQRTNSTKLGSRNHA